MRSHAWIPLRIATCHGGGHLPWRLQWLQEGMRMGCNAYDVSAFQIGPIGPRMLALLGKKGATCIVSAHMQKLPACQLATCRQIANIRRKAPKNAIVKLVWPVKNATQANAVNALYQHLTPARYLIIGCGQAGKMGRLSMVQRGAPHSYVRLGIGTGAGQWPLERYLKHRQGYGRR